MRIIAGALGGRQFTSPHAERTHPMSERVRGGLFNALGDIDGLTVLDAFAGSGALSFEAISRGASSALAIDNDKRAQNAIERSIKELQLAKQVKLIRANCSSWSEQNPDQQFDLVIAAPPYDNLQPAAVTKLARHTRPGGLYVLDWPGKLDPPELEGHQMLNQKSYGDAQLVFYRRIS
ncbi:MAG TPA: RsmD family RNA methyltransferase [Candidatus Saccharimonadales bacterium]|nr:RsmD family RNA methyltransferase [Candidatus Saccharimonadales bacterium]